MAHRTAHQRNSLNIQQFAIHGARWKKAGLHGELVDFRGVVLVDDDDPQETSLDLGRSSDGEISHGENHGEIRQNVRMP